jgi:hypothetical protein
MVNQRATDGCAGKAEKEIPGNSIFFPDPK